MLFDAVNKQKERQERRGESWKGTVERDSASVRHIAEGGRSVRMGTMVRKAHEASRGSGSTLAARSGGGKQGRS